MDISKILEWVYTAKPELRDRKISDISASDLDLYRSLILEEFKEANVAIINSDIYEFIDAIVDSIWMVLNLAAMGGLKANQIESIAEVIQTSNDSKFCDSEEDAVQTVFLYGMGQHPDKLLQSIHTYSKKVGDRYVILRTEDDKIMKSWKYKSVFQLLNSD